MGFLFWIWVATSSAALFLTFVETFYVKYNLGELIIGMIFSFVPIIGFYGACAFVLPRIRISLPWSK